MPDFFDLPLLPLLYDVASFPFVATSMAITRSVLEREGSQTVLDVGAGTGSAALMLGRKFSVTSVEPSSHMREWAQIKGVKVLEGQAQNLPDSLGQFDAVIASYIFRYVMPEDFEAVLTPMQSHTKVGGLLVITDLLLPLLGPSAGQRRFLGVWTLHNPITLSQTIESRGFKLIASYYPPFSVILVFRREF